MKVIKKWIQKLGVCLEIFHERNGLEMTFRSPAAY